MNIMKFLIILLIFSFMEQESILYNFEEKTSTKDWQIINDGVMGGLSKGSLTISPEGHGIFSGQVSLENYGGFTSMRYRFNQLKTINYSKFILRIKGDGKRYQLRVKNTDRQAHSYIQYFTTNGEWQTIEIPFNTMYASFRGRKLDYPNYNGSEMEEISILIGNKKAESFKITIDRIILR